MIEYDKIFNWFIISRNAEVGLPDVNAFTRSLAPCSRVLDLGCGTGMPISQFLIQRGFDVFGIDSSARMIESFRANCPKAHVECARLEDSDFFNTPAMNGVTFRNVSPGKVNYASILATFDVSRSVSPVSKTTGFETPSPAPPYSRLHGQRPILRALLKINVSRLDAINEY
ncbi:MAG: class I SAM-dependent methyltransferase [Gemmatimonadaceae bacterium]